MTQPSDPREEKEMRTSARESVPSVPRGREREDEELPEARQTLEAESSSLTYVRLLLRATLEATSDGILLTDGRGHVADFNKNFLDMWGIPAELMEVGDRSRVEEDIARRLTEASSGYLARMEEILKTAPDETLDTFSLADGRTIERHSRKLTTDDTVPGRVWSFREITRRRIAERDHAYLAAIVSSSEDPIIAKTLKGVITSWNAAAERLFGYTAEEAVGRPITMLIPEDRIAEEDDILARVRRGERIRRFETERLTKNKRLIRVSLTISPVKDDSGKVIGASKMVHDISERDELLARERVARAHAEEASRLKDEFLATASHELRTPLNAIVGWTQILRMGGLEDEKAHHAIEVIERNARAQAQVIDDLLDVSRIITGKLHLEVKPIMPAASIESALDSVRPMAEAKGVTLQAVLDAKIGPISGDAGRLQQIVWNLLSNAIKFTPRGGRVQVRLERVDSHVEIVVSDSGEGINPEFLPFVFDRFRQADASAARMRGGLGLGLAIVRHLAELHGGSVSAFSAGKGQGAAFTIRLPLRPLRDVDVPGAGPRPKPRATADLRPPGGTPSLAGTRILVVDDEPDAREVLKEVLQRCGAEVRVAPSAPKGLEIVQAWRPSVVVSDIGMPGEDGYALIRKIREWELSSGVPRTPAVALTAYARSDDRIRALVAGYQVHVAKPIDPTELALVIAGVLVPLPSEPRRPD